MRHMHADLVRPAGFKVAFDQAGLGGGRFSAEFFLYAVVGDRTFGCGVVWVGYGHFQAIVTVSRDRVIYGAVERAGATPNKGAIGAIDGVFVKLGAEAFVGAVGFGRDQQAAGVFVQTVDNTGSQDAAYAGQAAAAMMEEGVDQGAAGIAGAWVGNQPRRFVDDDNVVVFENHVQGDVFGLGQGRLRGRNGNRDLVGGFQFAGRCGNGGSVYGDVAIFN